MAEIYRKIEVYESHFADFLSNLKQPVRDKIYWTLRLIETVPRVSEKYL